MSDPREVYRLWCISYKGAAKNDYNKARLAAGYTIQDWADLRDQGRSLTALDRKFKPVDASPAPLPKEVKT